MFTNAIRNPSTINPPGANTKASIPSPANSGLNPKADTLPSISLINPSRVNANVNPNPINNPSSNE